LLCSGDQEKLDFALAFWNFNTYLTFHHLLGSHGFPDCLLSPHILSLFPICFLAIIITRTRSGAFNALEVDQAVALVSTLVYTEKADGECKLRDELLSPLRQLQVRM
jgi:hypothetical protein